MRIWDVGFAVQRPIGRCAAIMANPDTGMRDARLLRILTIPFDQLEPTLGILLLPIDGAETWARGEALSRYLSGRTSATRSLRPHVP